MTTEKYSFAFDRSDFANHIATPLRAAFHHYCLVEWSRQQGTTHYLFDHWRAETNNLTAEYLKRVVDATTLKPSGRINVYLQVVAFARSQDDVLQEVALDHYLETFPEQKKLIKNKKLPKAITDKFWSAIHQKTKQALISAKLVGKQWSFELVFGPVA